MKKITAIILGVMVLAAGLLGCASCKPEEPDPNEGLYGVYKMYAVDKGGIEIDGEIIHTLPSGNIPQEVNDYIIELLNIAGDTITITKETVKFSGGSKQPEYEYGFYGSSHIYFKGIDIPNKEFPYDSLNFHSSVKAPVIYQLNISAFIDVGEKSYRINFYYKEYEKF